MTLKTTAAADAVRWFAEITKFDDEQRVVEGYASTTSLDSQGERVTKKAMEDALPDYMKFANLREMHGNSAAGVVKSAEVDDKGLYIRAHVVDDSAWAKVKAGVYKGFSIGGKSTLKKSGVIEGMRLTEISLVDRPANPECVIELFKGDGITLAPAATDSAAAQRDAVLKLADMLDKGGVDAVALLKFAQEGAASSNAGEGAPATATETVDPVAKAEAAAAAANAAADAAGAAEGDGQGQAQGEQQPAARRVLNKDAFGFNPKLIDTISKGMGATAALAMILKQLAYLSQDQVRESKKESDASKVPDMLHDLVVQGGKVLVAMAAEESGELADNVDPDNDDPDWLSPANTFTNSPFAYFEANGDVSKAGARFSKDTCDALSEIHDHVKSASSKLDALGFAGAPGMNGSNAAEEDPEGDAKKGHGADDIAKAALAKAEADLQAATAARDEALAKVADLSGRFDSLAKQFADLENKFSRMPAVPKGALRAVAKGEDLGQRAAAPAPAAEPEGPIKKADGTIDHAATAERDMRKALSKPVPLPVSMRRVAS